MTLKPASIAIILDDSGTEVLLVKRKDVPLWVLPGGGVEEGESPIEAVVRESLEETGYAIEVVRQSAEYSPINRLAALTSVFICRITGGVPRLSSETSSIGFFSLNDLPSTLFSLHQDWLKDAFSHSELIKKPLTQVTYWAVINHFFKHPLHLLCYLWTRLTKK